MAKYNNSTPLFKPVIGQLSKFFAGDCLEAFSLSCIRDDRVLFQNLAFRLKNGQALILEGRNGSGKSSLLRIICGIRRPESGAVTWNGEPIENLARGYHACIAYVGHLDGIKLELTVFENLSAAISLGRPSGLSIASVLEKINLSGYREVMGRALSAGQRRRLALARLLINANPLWILDEPFTALDRDGIILVEKLIVHHIDGGGMVVMASHHEGLFGDLKIQRIRLGQ